MKPSVDQIEISIFGPGWGECIVVHLGGANWIVIDSCINNRTGTPVSLEYLAQIGVNPRNVHLVIATHWHDDHIRGMAKQLRAFENARFCSSAALTDKEFLATIVSYDDRHGIVSGSGATELCEVIQILRGRVGRTTPIKSAPARLVFKIDGPSTGHGSPCQVITLSPSDKQFDKFMGQLAKLAPIERAAKRRVPNQSPNDLSVVTLIVIGDHGILLGADLEETKDVELGWSAIVRLPERPKIPACIFKIPHHGSKNGHCEDVWKEMLLRHPLAVITPWSSGLPTLADVKRISELTGRGFLTSIRSDQLNRQRPYAVEKQIRETVGRLKVADAQTGWVRLRNGGAKNPTMWCVELSDEACHLDELVA